MNGSRERIQTSSSMRELLVICLSANIAACAPTQTTLPRQLPMSWHNIGATGTLNTDLGQCQIRGYSTPGLDPTPSMMVFLGCMQARGWSFY